MRKSVLSCVAASALFLASAAAIAQPSTAAASTGSPLSAAAPAGRYTGPSSAALITVKQLVASGKDDQYAKIQGKIVSHDQGKKYTFADDSGSMTVEISPKRFPPGQTISAEQRVELSGKLDKSWNKTEFEVKEIRLLP